MGSEVEKLLQGTPIGVYQLGHLISGPLGVVESQEKRYVPPSLEFPLWHCSDTGCNHLHDVSLLEPSVPVVDAYSRIKKTLTARFGPQSEWTQPLVWTLRGAEPRRYVDLLAFVADCIIGRERALLVEAALKGVFGKTLRDILALPPRRKRDADGPASEVASRIGADVQLQLLLTLRDQDLVGLIDDAVLSKAIKIPLGETRVLSYSTPRGHKDSVSEMSALGIRSVKEDALVNLTSAVMHAYQRLSLVKELEWRVRGDATKAPYEAFVAFVRTHGPAESIRELVLSSAGITDAVCKNLKIPLKYASGTDDTAAVDRVLWKLGFNPMQFDDSISRFRTRLSEFNNAVLSATPIDTEDAREKIRAAGVNVFVSLEDFVDRLITYNVWLLSSDHFLITDFSYSSADARRSVGSTLGLSLQSGEATFPWSVEGENPLGTLLLYLRAAADWIQSLSGKDRRSVKRREEDLPHFADNERLPFPFRHVELWADSDPDELQRYADLFGRIVKQIEGSEPASIRNGLDHFRESESFPSSDKLLACVARLGQALELADVHRFLPKVFWMFGRKGNRFNAVENEFRDYANRLALVYGPQLVSGLELISYQNASLLAPGNLLGSPNSSLIFRLHEPSEFSLYWQDYPRRRKVKGGIDAPHLAREAELTSGGSTGNESGSTAPPTDSTDLPK
jgi:hypothetical protein